jgi:protein CWC15
MSGSGRPTYRPRKGTADPAAAYVKSRHAMVRDLPGNLAIRAREKRDFTPEELSQKLAALGAPAVSLAEADAFDDADESGGDSGAEESGGDSDADAGAQGALLRELARLKRERAEEEARRVREARAHAIKELTAPPADPGYSMKLSWTEEAVFHGQAVEESRHDEREDANDPVRNPAHYRFLQKYLHT